LTIDNFKVILHGCNSDWDPAASRRLTILSNDRNATAGDFGWTLCVTMMMMKGLSQTPTWLS